MSQHFPRSGWSLVTRVVLCIQALLCVMTWAVEPARLAILGNDRAGWCDLLTASLSQHPAVALVERDDLGTALNEIALQELLVNRAKRSRFGTLAGADFLVLLDVTENRIHLTICDTRLGVTLRELHANIPQQPEKEAIDTLANATLQTLASFAGGVKQVVSVPDFVCRDLTFDFTYLQSDYAELLRSAYLQIPGLAVVAIEEAKAIAAERDLTGLEQKNRLVSVFIDGEYRTTRAANDGKIGVEITLRARDASRVLLERKLPSVAPGQAGRELIAVFVADLAVLAAPGGATIDQNAQFRLLIERAGQFGALGEFQRSAELREAALLLKPDADPHRIALIREYTRLNLNPYETQSWPKDANFDESNPLWVAAFNRAVNGWKRSLQHCEYLVLNRRLSREEATDLAYHAIHSISGVRAGSSHLLADCEELKKDFVGHVFARIASLDPAPTEVRAKLTGALDVYHFIFEAALCRCDGNCYKADDLDLVADLLVNRLPASMAPDYGLNSFLKTAAIRLIQGEKGAAGFTEAEYLAFLQRLVSSDRPLARVYGRYGHFCLRQARGEKSPQLLEEMQGVFAAAKEAGFDLREYDFFMDQLKDEVWQLTYELKSQSEHTAQLPSKPAPESKPILPSRVILEPVALRLKHSAGKNTPLTPDMRWDSNNEGWHGVTHFQRLTKELDALWGRTALLFMPRRGELVRVLADEKPSFADVKYDGSYVWVAAYYDWGVSVLDRNGRELTRITRKDGLPPSAHYGLVVHPLEPGRVLVSGSFGNENRGWIAVLRFDGHKAKVDVIHEATKIWDYKDLDDRNSTDPTKTFSPEAVIEHVIPGPKSRRLIFIQRRNNSQPLMVDPETLKVTVYPADPANQKWFPRSGPPAGAFLSDHGILWVAGSMDDFSSFRFNETTGLFDRVREHEGCDAGNGTSGSIVRDGEWIYFAGYQWRRLNLQTDREEQLVEDPRALPHYGSGGCWRLMVSAHYGLVAFFEDKGELYHLKIAP